MSPWTLLVDFDGTISLEDVTDSLLIRFGRPGWDSLEAEWREGRIGSRECMAGQIALLDCSRSELDEHLSSMAIDPAFPAFVAAARAAGMPLKILSDGLDHAIEFILARHGLAGLPITANHLVEDGPRRWRLEFPHARPDCRTASGTCKCAFTQAPMASPGERFVMVGDGASDFCVAGRAQVVFAKKRLLDHCLDTGLPHQPVANFDQALALLPGLSSSLAADTHLTSQDQGSESHA
ncbi:MtnX-like HAD-IB family phosphatase [soil metagenome]